MATLHAMPYTLPPLTYIIQKGVATPVKDMKAWTDWMEQEYFKHIKHDTANGLLVSTVFTGINQNADLRGEPLLWETMIFCTPEPGSPGIFKSFFDAPRWRYSTQEHAYECHAVILKTIQSGYSHDWIRKRLEEL